MEEKKSCDVHDGSFAEHGEESCCEGKCYICDDGKWLEEIK